MAYFHSKWTKIIGGRRRTEVHRVVGETLEEMRSVARRWPEHVWINWPRRSIGEIRSKSQIRMYVDAKRPDILESLESTPVSENHVKLLTCLLRQAFFEQFCQLTDDDRKWLQTQVRGTLHQLLRLGDWVDEPETLSLKKLNARLEKFDLGRRSDLKFSSQQSEIQKYDPDAHRKDLAELTHADEIDARYRTGNKQTRQDLWDAKPWLHSKWLEAGFGEP